MGVYTGYGASIYVASGTPVAFSNEATTASSGYKVYTITNSAKRFWARQYPITVRKNGNIVSAGYTLQYPGGKVIFTTANQPTDVITVSGYYIPVSQVGQANEWSLDIDSETTEVTYLGTMWKEYVPLQIGATGSLKQWWFDEFFFAQLPNLLGFELNIDSTKAYRFYGYITKDSISVVANGIVEESVNFVADGQVYYG